MDIVKFLTVERHCDLSQNVILHCAVLGGNLDIVKFLVEELKCPVDITGPHNKTPLKLAESMNCSDIAQYLQEHSVMPYIYTAIAVMKHTAISMVKQLNWTLEITRYASKYLPKLFGFSALLLY